jgi:hypothetical protein
MSSTQNGSTTKLPSHKPLAVYYGYPGSAQRHSTVNRILKAKYEYTLN